MRSLTVIDPRQRSTFRVPLWSPAEADVSELGVIKQH